MVYLLIFSLVLHLVSFFVMLILYQKIESAKPLDKEKTLKEMEDMLVAYTTEIKADNEKLARRLNNLSLEETAEAGEKSRPEMHPDGVKNSSERPEETYQDYSPPIPEEPQEEVTIASSDTSKVLLMHQQGYHAEDIARYMRMGAGEVELLLKFYK